ncbi:unnamed protein product, partial [Prunus brigantina]
TLSLQGNASRYLWTLYHHLFRGNVSSLSKYSCALLISGLRGYLHRNDLIETEQRLKLRNALSVHILNLHFLAYSSSPRTKNEVGWIGIQVETHACVVPYTFMFLSQQILL